MPEKIFKYDSEEITVSWDKHKCIHAAACVHGLPDVFNINEKPWIQPDKSSADAVADAIMKCPSGALQFERKDGGDVESAPDTNSVEIVANGPVYIHGDLHLKNLDGVTIANETRVALCRCGLSKNKPYCDNSHIDGKFEADTSFNPERLLLEETDEKGGALSITLFPNAPFVLEGTYTVSGSNQTVSTKKKMSFCRCGASANKPFCDGGHKAAGFSSEN